LKHVSFAVPEGQVCGLLGPNGSGKTTLFRLMMGILKPTSGSLTIAGLNAFDDRVALKRMMGYLPDEPIFYAYMSGREILELSAAMHGRLVEPTMQELAPLIEALRLDTELDHYADDYSRGTKKKLGLLLALLHRPRLLVLDEPTNGLDVESTHRFYDIVRAEAARGTTVLLSTHLMDHVTAICSHVIVIDKGSVKASGDLDELRTQYGGVTLEQVFLHLTTGSPV
jgi:ABC-type multidrug transport system ATPase subunit